MKISDFGAILSAPGIIVQIKLIISLYVQLQGPYKQLKWLLEQSEAKYGGNIC